MIKAIIFDMDGVIVDSIPMHFKIWKNIFRNRGISLSLKEFEKYNGRSTYEIAEIMIKKYNLDDTPENISKEKLDYEIKLREKEIKLFKDAIPVLKKLKKDKYKLALATASQKHILKFILKKFKFEKYFDSITHVEEVKKSKPAPDIFLLAAKKLKVNPKDCVVIEDALNGIIAAKKAGMKSIAITTTFQKKVFEKKADKIITYLKELSKKMIEGA